jgi:hypothetical protein
MFRFIALLIYGLLCAWLGIKLYVKAKNRELIRHYERKQYQ